MRLGSGGSVWATSSVIILIATLSVQAADKPAVFSPRPVLRLPVGAPEGLVDIIIHAVGPDVERLTGAPTLKDVQPDVQPADDSSQTPRVPPAAGAPGAPPAPAPTPASAPISVTFGTPIELPDSDPARRAWRVPLQVKRMPSAGTTSVRSAAVSWGDVQTTIGYSISNAATPALTMKVLGLPAEWSVTGEPVCFPVRVALGNTRATGLLVTSTLIEQSTKRAAPSLFLSVNRQTAAGPEQLEVAANDAAQSIHLCTPANLAPGKYQGIVNVSAAEKPEGDPQNPVVYVTNNTVRAFGGVLVGLGCLFAFFFRVLVPSRIIRAQALLPASLLRDQGQSLLARLDIKTAPQTHEHLSALVEELTEARLVAKRFLPTRVATAFGSGVDVNGYKLFLDDCTAQLARFQVIVEGLERATELGASPADLKEIDDLGPDVPRLTIDDVKQSVATVIQRLAEAARTGPVPPVSEPGSQQLVLQIERLNASVWVAWTLLAFGTGVVMLVVNQPAFGVPLDYLYCVLWGFGVPTAGQQISAGTASTALGVTLPAPRN